LFGRDSNSGRSRSITRCNRTGFSFDGGYDPRELSDNETVLPIHERCFWANDGINPRSNSSFVSQTSTRWNGWSELLIEGEGNSSEFFGAVSFAFMAILPARPQAGVTPSVSILAFAFFISNGTFKLVHGSF
jgi:hypothetical protein